MLPELKKDYEFPRFPGNPEANWGPKARGSLKRTKLTENFGVCSELLSIHPMEVETKPHSPVSRNEWRIIMRKSFCRRDMIDEDGNLVKESVESHYTHCLDTFI